MSDSLHHPATVTAVAEKIFLIANPLGSFSELNESQIEAWESQAVEVIDLAVVVPTEGITFFDDLAPVEPEVAAPSESGEDLLAPWHFVPRPVANNPVMDQVNSMRQEAQSKVKLGVASDGKDVWADSTEPHTLVTGAPASGKRILSLVPGAGRDGEC